MVRLTILFFTLSLIGCHENHDTSAIKGVNTEYEIRLFYSKSFLGHFTLVVRDPVDNIAYRVHLVDKDALTVKENRLAWAVHKIRQVTGTATSEMLLDLQSSPAEVFARIDYDSKPGVKFLKTWNVSYEDGENMLRYIFELQRQQKEGQYGRYGYIIRSNQVDNCGSFVVKALDQAGVCVQMPYFKSYCQLPSLIKDDI